MQPKDINKLYRRSVDIDGWFSREAATLITLITEAQREKQIRGDIFEVGVHHGKSSVFLAGLLAKGERLCVCDIFGQQELNESFSGRGDRAIFQENVGKYLVDDRITVYQELSTGLTPDKIGRDRYRIFHVDGGHNFEEAYSDLLLAADTLVEGGVIVLDDPLRVAWPAVTEALLAFLQKRTDFQAVVLGFNKMIFAKRDYVASYRAAFTPREIRRQHRIAYPYGFKQLPFAGEELDIFYLPVKRSLDSVRSKVGRFLAANSGLARFVGK